MSIKEQNESNLFEALKGVELSKVEIKSLKWLAGWERDTVNNIVSIIKKLKTLNK